jgi:hypothetical protein
MYVQAYTCLCACAHMSARACVCTREHSYYLSNLKLFYCTKHRHFALASTITNICKVSLIVSSQNIQNKYTEWYKGQDTLKRKTQFTLL